MGVCQLRAFINAMTGKAGQICGLTQKGNNFESSDKNRSSTILSGRYNCNFENVFYLLQSECWQKIYVSSTKTKFWRGFMFTNSISGPKHKHNEGTLESRKLILKANFFSHFSKEITTENLMLLSKLLKRAENVF